MGCGVLSSVRILKKIDRIVSAECHWTHWWQLNALAPGKFKQNFRQVIFKLISVIDGWGITCEIALRWISLDLTDDKSTLVQVMAWCLMAPSHYLRQCWPRYMSPYGVTRPQWVKIGWSNGLVPSGNKQLPEVYWHFYLPWARQWDIWSPVHVLHKAREHYKR